MIQTKLIVLPNNLYNPIAVKGLDSPLLSIADILDEQNQPLYALACREAATICKAFAAINLEETHQLYKEKEQPILTLWLEGW
jgi:hypothetical protein